MKRYICFSCVSFLLLFSTACQKDNVLPDRVTPASDIIAKGEICNAYYFSTKTNTVPLGQALGSEIVIGFYGTVPLPQQQKIFKKFKAYQAVSRQLSTLSGPVTFISLKPGTSCSQTEALVENLEILPLVRFALPALQAGTYWNEFIIHLESGTEDELFQLAANTKTTIVADPTSLWPGVYMISTDKHSKGNVFEMASFYA
jgi:hypothetical protein